MNYLYTYKGSNAVWRVEVIDLIEFDEREIVNVKKTEIRKPRRTHLRLQNINWFNQIMKDINNFILNYFMFLDFILFLVFNKYISYIISNKSLL